MTESLCGNCGWPIRSERKHETSQEGFECIVREIDTERVVGWSRRKQPKDLYKKR